MTLLRPKEGFNVGGIQDVIQNVHLEFFVLDFGRGSYTCDY